MEKNPCYEDHRVPEYEELHLQNKEELTHVKVKLPERSIADNTNMYAATSIKKVTNLKAKWIGLVVVLSLLAIAMVAAIALFVYAIVSSNQGMDSLMKEIQELKMQLNKTKEASETEIAQLRKDLNYTLTRIETDGFNLLNAANMTQLNSLQSSVRSLTTRVNSPVNLYQNCIHETENCTSTQSGSGYSQFCSTPSLPVNKSVSCNNKTAVLYYLYAIYRDTTH